LFLIVDVLPLYSSPTRI